MNRSPVSQPFPNRFPETGSPYRSPASPALHKAGNGKRLNGAVSPPNDPLPAPNRFPPSLPPLRGSP
jgi:hypothetical protein